jgi:type VI protein secretion system component Hcp
MAKGEVLDILMMMKANGTAIDAEGFSTFDSETGWTDDFQTGKFFEIDDFDLGLGLVDQDSSAPPKGTQAHNSEKEKSRTGKFSKWVQAVANVSPTPGQQIYPVQMDEFSFSRQTDCASPILFKNCFKAIPFDSAAVIVRKAGGLQGQSHHVGRGLPFLRVDFKYVLMTDISMDCGDVIKEKCKFVCRQVQVKYRMQKPDGTGGKMVYTGVLDLQKANSG